MAKTKAQLIEDIVEDIKPLLAGKAPEMQGAVLADLLAIWLAGHRPELRQQVLSYHITRAWELVEPNEKIMFGDAGFPDMLQ